MNCEEALELLSGHLDGQNTEEEEARLQAHLKGCPSCRAILQAYEQMQQGLVSLDAEPPKELHQRIMDQVRSQPVLHRSRKHLWRTGGTIAAAAVIALVLLVGGKEWFAPGNADPAPSPALTSMSSSDAAESKAMPDASEDVETETNQAQAAEADAASAAPETQETAPVLDEKAVESATEETSVAPETRAPVPYAAEVPTNGTENASQAPASSASDAALDADASVSPVPNVAIVSDDTITEDAAVVDGTVTEDAGAESQEPSVIPLALVARLVDDPQQPAATTITQLHEITPEEAEDGSGMQYVSDVATVRTIIADYADIYVITPPEGLEQAGDAEPCAILVLAP